MYLKEAFRYQNYLGRLISSTTTWLRMPKVIMKKTQIHQRSVTNPGAIDETVTNEKERPVDYETDALIRFLDYCVEQKLLLTAAISRAKAACEAVDIDGELANNRVRQEVAAVMSHLASVKQASRITTGRGFKFNAEGNQVQYMYDIEEKDEPWFDRDIPRDICKKYLAAADGSSEAIERAMVMQEVDYTPPFNINDSWDDAMDAFLAQEKAEG